MTSIHTLIGRHRTAMLVLATVAGLVPAAGLAAATTEPPTDTASGVQAPGWVEADPFPIAVTALTDGIVEEMLALEGQPGRTGRSTNGFDLPPECPAVAAHGEMQAYTQSAHQGRLRKPPSRDKRRHVVTRDHRERPQPFPSRHPRNFMRAR